MIKKLLLLASMSLSLICSSYAAILVTSFPGQNQELILDQFHTLTLSTRQDNGAGLITFTGVDVDFSAADMYVINVSPQSGGIINFSVTQTSDYFIVTTVPMGANWLVKISRNEAYKDIESTKDKGEKFKLKSAMVVKFEALHFPASNSFDVLIKAAPVKKK